jgi:hypothetical protein
VSQYVIFLDEESQDQVANIQCCAPLLQLFDAPLVIVTDCPARLVYARLGG